jgi:signal transduction histidine kinase
MRLSEFIRSNLDDIIEEWEAGARRRAPDHVAENVGALRDNAALLLRAIADRLDGAEPEQGQPHGVQTAGEAHGAERAEQGFTLEEMIGEYPALRTTVVRLWEESAPPPNADTRRDLQLFHAAVDMALTQSVREFMGKVDRAKELFIGILGHDLRDPLSTMLMSAKMLRDLPATDERRGDILEGIVRAGERMNRMVSDLLDFTRSRTGQGIPVAPRPTDLRKVIEDAAKEITGAHPEREVSVEVRGDLRGEWDDQRIGQALGNLLGNAVQHGAAKRPIEVSVHGDDREVSIEVHNEGSPIPPDQQRTIFEAPTISGEKPMRRHDGGHLGLGLYITSEIARRHGGSVEIASSADGGTTFTMRLPRHASTESEP